MSRAFAMVNRFVTLPRGWTILGLALASWVLLVLTFNIASALFAMVVASV
jgi:hypothetical protein